MKRLLYLLVIGCLFLTACGKVGYEDRLPYLSSDDSKEEYTDWKIELCNYQTAPDEIKAVYNRAKVKYEPQMYIGYQTNFDGIRYMFTCREDTINRLVIILQDFSGKLSITSDTADYDLLKYFIH